MALARDLGFRSRAHMLTTLTAREFKEWTRYYREVGLCQPDSVQRLLAHVLSTIRVLGGGKKQEYRPEMFWSPMRPQTRTGIRSADDITDDDRRKVTAQARVVFAGFARQK